MHRVFPWVTLALWSGCGNDVAADVEVVPPACQTDADCDDGEACWVNPVAAFSVCVPACETDDDCDDGLQCREMFDTLACVNPLPAEPVVPPERDDEDLPVAPEGTECVGAVNGPVAIDFTVDADTTSVMVMPFATDGGSVRPQSWTLPDDTLVFGDGQAGFLGVTSSLLGVTAPLFLPQSPLLDPLLLPGTHRYVVNADTDELCFYTLIESQATSAAQPTLDVNLIFVGLDDLDAESAAEDADLSAALDTLDAIFAAGDVQLGTVRFEDASPEVADAFAVIDAPDDIDALMATSLAPGRGDDALLSVNLFVVASIDLPNSGAIGISQGLPGPAGLHGSPASGVVLTGEFLRARNADNPTIGAELTGVVMAHEIGHWLGLFHTSELAGGVQDPIEDTPGCNDIADREDFADLAGCPDRFNLMFPVADPNARELTADQGAVLRANPVTR